MSGGDALSDDEQSGRRRRLPQGEATFTGDRADGFDFAFVDEPERMEHWEQGPEAYEFLVLDRADVATLAKWLGAPR